MTDRKKQYNTNLAFLSKVNVVQKPLDTNEHREETTLSGILDIVLYCFPCHLQGFVLEFFRLLQKKN